MGYDCQLRSVVRVHGGVLTDFGNNILSNMRNGLEMS